MYLKVKTQLVKILRQRNWLNGLRRKAKKTVLYAESGTGSEDLVVRGLADLAYKSKMEMDYLTRALIYVANRNYQWKKLAEPALERGEIVITTRNWFSTLIYEGIVGGAPLETLKEIHKLVMPERYFKPDKIILLTMSDEMQAKRLIAQGRKTEEFFKSADDAVRKAINAGYRQVAREFGVTEMDASGSIEEVFGEVKRFIEE